jgi:hypothetical protein
MTQTERSSSVMFPFPKVFFGFGGIKPAERRGLA